MNKEPQVINNKAKLVYVLITLLGLVLSFIVYVSAQKVEVATHKLVKEAIPTVDKLQHLAGLITEQERFLYEYYATDDPDTYKHDFITTYEESVNLVDELKPIVDQPAEIQAMYQLLTQINRKAFELDENMASPETDWDLAREQLANLTDLRSDIMPHIARLSSSTDEWVEKAHDETESQLYNTYLTVIIYSMAILIVAVIIGRYFKSYVFMTAKSQRLSLFAQRNPNPIISLDDNNEITYANPATFQLLKSISSEDKQVSSLIAKDIGKYQKMVIDNKRRNTCFEFQLENLILECDLNWLPDQNAWDLHITDITARKNAEEELIYQAYHDDSSGLFNHNKLVNVLDTLTSGEEHFALGMFEIRGYNHIVSSRGIEISLQLVNSLASQLEEIVQRCDNAQQYRLFHISDKGFALIIDGAGCEESIRTVVEQIESQVEAITIFGEQHLELDFGFTCSPEHGKDKNTLIKHTRIALEEAINIEHSSLIIFQPELAQKMHQELELTQKLRNAIRYSKLELHFQPQVESDSGNVVGAETLIRWNHKGQWISPGEFIPLAEKTGMIIKLGEWILRQACKKAKELVDAGYKDIVVAVNISPNQFKHPDFSAIVDAALKESKLPPRNLELEITEGVIMHSESDVIALLQTLKDKGLMLSIDDFGTGYSSLSYLKNFPIDKLKIDQSFIRNLQNSKEDQAIVRTVIDLGNNLGLKLIAEGVETKEQLKILQDMKCDEIQGYYFSRPLNSKSLDDFLHNRDQQMVG